MRAAIGEFNLDDPRQLISLLVGMARNKLAERVRHHHRQSRDVRRVNAGVSMDQASVAVNETPSQLVSGRELLAEIRARLSEEETHLADLRARGLDWDAVAAALGGTPEGRRKQLARAVARLGRALGLDSTAMG